MSASSLNLCQFIGRLGQDPTTTSLPSGGVVVNLSLAVDWKTKEKEGVEWVRVVAFNKLAEIIGQYCRKGQQIYISGSQRTRKWQDKEGRDQYTTEIVANQMQMLGSKSDGSSGGRAASQAEQYGYQPHPPATEPAGDAPFDDDIPF